MTTDIYRPYIPAWWLAEYRSGKFEPDTRSLVVRFLDDCLLSFATLVEVFVRIGGRQ